MADLDPVLAEYTATVDYVGQLIRSPLAVWTGAQVGEWSASIVVVTIVQMLPFVAFLGVVLAFAVQSRRGTFCDLSVPRAVGTTLALLVMYGTATLLAGFATDSAPGDTAALLQLGPTVTVGTPQQAYLVAAMLVTLLQMVVSAALVVVFAAVLAAPMLAATDASWWWQRLAARPGTLLLLGGSKFLVAGCYTVALRVAGTSTSAATDTLALALIVVVLALTATTLLRLTVGTRSHGGGHGGGGGDDDGPRPWVPTDPELAAWLDEPARGPRPGASTAAAYIVDPR